MENDNMEFLHPISLLDLVSRNTSIEEDNSEYSNEDFSLKINLKRTLSTKEQWKIAAEKALHLSDPWEKFHLDELECETAKRYRFNALKQSWITDTVKVKVSNESFSRGAMRECFRIKKLSNFAHNNDWKSALNYVVKRYITPVSRDVYLDDIKLQMEAKLWSEEYNRSNPPKKVDIMQVSVLEFVSRPGSPLYHLEHYIEGNYVKYNSNSGFISSENVRLTPQAFSHFTFERSGHELIVVDIQGVGDLYTDPQIHTSDGNGYGEGNLGTRGMALFFRSHVCNHICTALKLSPFDLSPSEMESNQQVMEQVKNGKTQIRKISNSHLPFLSQRSHNSVDSNFSVTDYDEGEETEEFGSSLGSDSGIEFHNPILQRLRVRCESESSFDNTEEDHSAFQECLVRRSRPSCVYLEEDNALTKVMEEHQSVQKPILGQIHMDLVVYYEQGRFTSGCVKSIQKGLKYDQESALFHLYKSGDCGHLEAIITLSNLHLKMPRDHLVEMELEANLEKGLHFLTLAALAGDYSSALELARRYDVGDNLGKQREQSWYEAIKWYEIAAKISSSGGEGDMLGQGSYTLMARQAEMYRTGGNDLFKNCYLSGELYTKAGDLAMAGMKGRLASQFYSLAEEVWAEIEE